MKFGILTMNTDESYDPVELARRVEGEGIESIFLPDHSHVPVKRKVPYGGPREAFEDSPSDMPREYHRSFDQLVTLAAMSSVTSTLRTTVRACG